MMMQPTEDKRKLRNAHSLPSSQTITRKTQILAPWYHHLFNGKSTGSPSGRNAWSIHFGALQEFALAIPNFSCLKKMDPSDSNGCTLLSLTPPPHSPNDNCAGVTPLPRTLINAGHCHWPGLREGTYPHIQEQCSSSLGSQRREQYKC